MKNKIAIIHYLPLEFYPPVINILNSISIVKNVEAHVFSSYNNKKRKSYVNDTIDEIFRVPSPKLSDNSIIRLFKYIYFNLRVFFKLCRLQPDSILYYESYSVGPVYWYLVIFQKKTRLNIHFHEYFSPVWYANGMKLVKRYHQLEQNYLYRKAFSISQTNEDRIALFLKDNVMVSSKQMFTLPNYPPTKWCLAQKELKPNFAKVVKTIYIGTLSMDYCYIKEYCEWVSKMSGKVLFDVYGYNIEEETHHFLKELNCPFVRYFSGGIEYDDIPKLLSSYDVGVILYKALTENFKFNAPNKLFEYMACGLEVWYSEKILGIKPYNKNTYPRILSVKFTNIPTTILLDTKKLDTEPHQPFFAETVYKPYLKKIIP